MDSEKGKQWNFQAKKGIIRNLRNTVLKVYICTITLFVKIYRMLTAILIDDELKSRQILRQGLIDFQQTIEVVAEADTVKSGIRAIQKFQPDIVFLDIQLSDGTGFDILEYFREEINFYLVFVTAYNQFALKAFEYSVIDYLVKPLHPDKLKRAVQKICQNPKQQIKEHLDMLLNINKGSDFEKIGLSTQEATFFVYLKDIIRCEGESYYTIFFMSDGRKIIVSKTIKEYELLLKDADFFRIHKSHIINLNCIQQYKTTIAGGEIRMKDGEIVPIARRRKTAFLRMIKA